MRRIPISLLVLGLLATAAPASAEGPRLPKVYVAPYASVHRSLPVELGVQVAKLLHDELAQGGQVEAVAGPTVEGAAAPSVDAAKEQAKKIRRAERLVAQGDEAAGQLKFDAAASRYRAALKIYEQNLAALEDPAPLVEVRLKLATALFRTDMEEEGERRLAEVVALAPEIELDPARYPPLFLRTFEGIRDKLLRLPRGAISVLSTPPGAAVYLDGRKVAETPALLTEVVRGPHYIRVEAAGVPPHVTRVDVDPKEVARVEAQLGGALSGEAAPLVAALAENEVDGKVVKALATLAKRAGAEFVVFGSIRKGEDVYDVKSFLYSRKSRKIAALTDIAFDFDLLGASIEVYKLAGEVAEAVQAFPSPLIVPAPIFPGVRAQKAKLTEVVAGPPVPRGPVAGASPAGAAPPPASAAAPAAASGPVQPASGGPAEPVARGPVAPAAGGPVQPAAREPLTTSRGGPVAPVPATGGSAAAGPVRPARPVSGGAIDVEETAGATRQPAAPITAPARPAAKADAAPPARQRQVVTVGGPRGRLLDPGAAGARRYAAVDIDEIVIPKDEVEEEKGWPWWAWGLLVVGVAGAGAGGYFAATETGLLQGSASDATVTFRW